jgi:hypothetical protein
VVRIQPLLANCAYNRRTAAALLSAKLSANQPAQWHTLATLHTAPDATSPVFRCRGSALTRKRSLVQIQYRPPVHPWSDAVSAHSLRRLRNICARATPTRLFVRVVRPMRLRSPPAGYNDVASTALRLLAGALRDSPGSREQSAVNAWLGRADRRYSSTFAPPPPGRPAFTTLRSSGQWVHVHRTNIAPFGPPRGSRSRWIGAPFRRVVEADVGEGCLSGSFDCEFEVVPVDLDLT